MRVRWPFTIIWTALCALAVGSLAEDVAAPVDPRCFESCGHDLERFLIAAIIFVWLTVTVLAAWLWALATRIRCPSCRKVVDPPVRFCPNCSSNLLASTGAPSETEDR